MKRFTSYGPPDPETEFMVERPALVASIAARLVGDPRKGGHYFTVFAPRQVGKTTTLRQVVQRLRETQGDTFQVGMATMHSLKDFRRAIPRIFELAFGMEVPKPEHWDEVQKVFSHSGPLKKPTLLILDEFDALPGPELSEAVATFRQLYLERTSSRLHGLALIGVQAVLGDVEGTTSPFNIQRSVHIPNLTKPEVQGLLQQYVVESQQAFTPEAVESIWSLFRGQPGLTCWFGELLTEKYNPVQPPPCEREDGPPPEGYPPLDQELVTLTTEAALYEELNNNIRNLFNKARGNTKLLGELFSRHDLHFDLNRAEILGLHVNGIVVGVPDQERPGRKVCAFASPFVQRTIFSAFGATLSESYRSLELAGPEALGTLQTAVEDVDIEALLTLFRSFLVRQAAKGEAPWLSQPTRTDARAFEAIGHFTLYAWLYAAVKGKLAITPEFPTGNGTADLLVKSVAKQKQEVLELKSYSDQASLLEGVRQVSRYARRLSLRRAWLVVMADSSSHAQLLSQQEEQEEGGVKVRIVPVAWGWVPGEVPVAVPVPVSSPAPVSAGGEGLRIAEPTRPVIAPSSERPHAPVPAALSIDDRLALEDRVLPLLTSDALLSLWLRCGLDERDALTGSLGLWWDQLLTRCLRLGSLPGLARLLERQFPELKGDPLLETLRAVTEKRVE